MPETGNITYDAIKSMAESHGAVRKEPHQQQQQPLPQPPLANQAIVLISVIMAVVAAIFFVRQSETKSGTAALNPVSHIMKIYVYDVPEDLYGVALSSCDMGDMYAMELHLPELVRTSRSSYTTNPSAASFYLIPHRTTCFYHHCVFTRKIPAEDCKKLSAAALMKVMDFVTTTQPYWNESAGTNHLLAFTWDQAASVLGWIDQPIRHRIRNAIHITTLGTVFPYEDFDPHKDIVIPPYLNYTYWLTMKKIHAFTNRTVLAYFRGTIFEDVKYSFGVRQQLKQLSKLNDDIVVKEGSIPDYALELAGAKFALSPPGWVWWSPRIFQALVMGAVPVLFSDGIRLPFEYLINYRSFTFKIPQANVSQTAEILRAISEVEIQRKRKAANDAWQKLFFSLKNNGNDAFGKLIQELQRKRNMHPPIGYLAY